jgi:hypothetical protein
MNVQMKMTMKVMVIVVELDGVEKNQDWKKINIIFMINRLLRANVM